MNYSIVKTELLIALLVAVIWSSASVSAFGQKPPINWPNRYFSEEINSDSWQELTNKVNKVKIDFTIGKEAPARIAYHWGKTRPANWKLDSPGWQLLDSSKKYAVLDLGASEGEIYFWVAAEWDDPHTSEASLEHVVIDHTPPALVITYPTNKVTSQPWLQLLGNANEQLSGIHYVVVNSSGTSPNHDGFVSDQYFDREKFEFTTNYFQCYDIALTPGKNQIILRCSDVSGNQTTTNIEVVFTTIGDTNPPVITPRWPTNGIDISSSAFTARGTLDDYTASLKGIISGGGQTIEINGLVERNGTFWVENIPVPAKTNMLTLIATDAAGNSSQTSMTLIKSDVDLFIETTPKGDDLWKPSGLVTGHVTPGYDVYVNGAKAIVEPNGHWRVENAPIYGIGTATFDATAVPSEAIWAAKNSSAGIKNLLTSVADLKQEPIVLNPTQSACGNFAIRLSGTYKKNFVLMTSTNLSDWIPILTNYNSAATFDFTDTNAANYPCRFFRVVPLP